MASGLRRSENSSEFREAFASGELRKPHEFRYRQKQLPDRPRPDRDRFTRSAGGFAGKLAGIGTPIRSNCRRTIVPMHSGQTKCENSAPVRSLKYRSMRRQ